MSRRSLVFAVAAVFVLLGCATLFLSQAYLGSPQSQGVAAIGGPFSLVDDAGRPVTEAAIAGKPTVMYFGYTYCPDVCPTTLSDLSRWIAQLGPDADKMNYVFVTIDPDRDNVNVIHQYVSSFDKRIRGFTGTDAQIAQMAQEYRIYYKRVPAKSGNGYLMDHSASLYLLGPTGKFVGVIDYQEDDASALAKLKRLAQQTSDS